MCTYYEHYGMYVFFFFFQAEDGIRDVAVTGVQTCALPISSISGLEDPMNAFYEHHKNIIRFAYRCFDRILLHAAIQPFQQPERAVGFFDFYRQIYPVSRQLLRDISTQYHNWVKNRSQKWRVPI